ncbi:MAG: Tat pathway signal protein, partial [Pseudomonadota bacterium]
MNISKMSEISRRNFLRRAGQVSIMGAASATALGLLNTSQAAAFSAGGGYKALVCIFLYGGMDHNSLLVPYDTANYDLYSAIRGGGDGRTAGGIAVGRDELSATVLNPSGGQTLTNNIRYALAPQMTRMRARFNQGVMAPLLNVGPLVVPLTFRSGA